MSGIAGPSDVERLDFTKGGGLLPVVAQHAHTGEVLMLAYADRDALLASLRDGEMWFRSRSRNTPWRKGETSGDVLRVVSLHADCDADAVLARVLPAGAACHTGATSCFSAPPTLPALAATIADRAGAAAAETAGAAPGVAPSYTRRLLDEPNLRLKKLGEEAVELALACANGEPGRVAGEAADLLFHLLVAAAAAGAPLSAILAELATRQRPAG